MRGVARASRRAPRGLSRGVGSYSWGYAEVEEGSPASQQLEQLLLMATLETFPSDREHHPTFPD